MFNPEYIKIIKSQGWTIDIHQNSNPLDGDFEVAELSKRSPLGEDFSFEVSTKDFVDSIYEYFYDFDVDEHVMLWIDSLGRNGVPSSISALVEDAGAIAQEIYNLYKALHDYTISK